MSYMCWDIIPNICVTLGYIHLFITLLLYNGLRVLVCFLKLWRVGKCLPGSVHRIYGTTQRQYPFQSSLTCTCKSNSRTRFCIFLFVPCKHGDVNHHQLIDTWILRRTNTMALHVSLDTSKWRPLNSYTLLFTFPTLFSCIVWLWYWRGVIW